MGLALTMDRKWYGKYRCREIKIVHFYKYKKIICPVFFVWIAKNILFLAKYLKEYIKRNCNSTFEELKFCDFYFIYTQNRIQLKELTIVLRDGHWNIEILWRYKIIFVSFEFPNFPACKSSFPSKSCERCWDPSWLQFNPPSKYCRSETKSFELSPLNIHKLWCTWHTRKKTCSWGVHWGVSANIKNMF